MHGALREIHGRASLVRFLVERAALLDVVRHIGDVDAEPEVTVRKSLDRNRIVEIAGVLAVDRDRRHAAKVRAALDVALLDDGAEPRGFGNGLLGMAVGNAELADDDLRVDAGFVDPSEHFDDPANGTSCRGRPSRDLDQYHLAGLG